MSTVDIVERLRSNEPLPVCPYGRKSPEYWTTPNDQPCKVCGGLPEGPDKCRGADTRIMAEAAAEITQLRAERDAAARARDLLLMERTDESRENWEIRALLDIGGNYSLFDEVKALQTAARDMRERCLAEVKTEGGRISNELATPPNVRGLMADDHALKFGASVTDRLYRAIHALPDTAVMATEGGSV